MHNDSACITYNECITVEYATETYNCQGQCHFASLFTIHCFLYNQPYSNLTDTCGKKRQKKEFS